MDIDAQKMSLTLLMLAAIIGSLWSTWENLGDAGKQDEHGRTALMYAAYKGNLEGAKLLISEAGRKTTKNGQVILDMTTFYFHPGMTALMMAARRGHANIIPLLEKEIGMKDNDGWTALMHAASKGHAEVVRILRPLEARLQDGKGQTALMHAVRGGHEECVDLLLLERDIKDGEGRTATEYAVDKKMRRVLLHQPVFPKLPDSLSAYRLTDVLGRGAFGTVYAAHGNGKNVAVKVVNLGGYSEEGREKLREEAKILLSLKHPNVIRCLGVGENDLNDTYAIVTELCCGDLHGEMDRRKRAETSYSDQEIWRIIRDVAAALTYLHEERVVHRDLKPGNVLLAPDGRCVLGDFGLAKALGDLSWMKTFAGTPLYMAPEIHRGESYDRSVDVWAMGVIGYEMCTGRLPFLRVAAIVGEDPPAIEGRGELANLISRMLSKDPRDRPTAQDVFEKANEHYSPLYD